MVFRRFRIVLIIVLTICVLGGICYIKLKAYSEIIYPSQSIRILQNLYYIDTREGFLYKTNTETKVNWKLSKDKIDNIGIIIFKNKLYYINKISKRLCSIELNGKNQKEIDICNIIMPYQPLFRLGVHIYYYNHENKLIRMDDKGFIEKIAKGKIEFSRNTFLKTNNKKIENIAII